MKEPAPEQVKEILYKNAEDLGKVGIDHETGYGRATTDFLDVGRIISDPEPPDVALSGCRGIIAGLIITLIVWTIIIAMI